MRTPPRLALTMGSDGSPGSERSLLSMSRPEDREKIDWGAGGMAIGLFLGLLAGSRLTFHSPVRRRSRAR
jgi:hypothetical protein